MIAPWPAANAGHRDPPIEREFAEFQAVLAGLRESAAGRISPARS